MADVPVPPGHNRGSDPTVGTLPSLGNSDFEALDQTLTLRGSYSDLRSAVLSATVTAGGEGAVEAIDVGGGDYWLRYYGDIELELDLSALVNIEVTIFAGFQGDGLRYSVGQARGFGAPRRLAAGGTIPLDPLRFKRSGLLEETLFVAALHQTGARATTSMDYRPMDGVVVLRQDI